MATQTQASLVQQVEEAAKAAGLALTGTAAAADFNGAPTTKFTLSLGERAETMELSADFELQSDALLLGIKTYMEEMAKRLKSPVPDVLLTLHGLPLRFGKFAWPFHLSSSGADTSLVHGEVKLEDGHDSPLHAKIAASLTRTFAEVVPALQQPYAESFIYNAVRKVMDQGQLELVKSGNRQPVVVTTRYYSAKRSRFVFNDTDATQRSEYVAAKVFWLSGVLGNGGGVWVADPRDAQYLNTTAAELQREADTLAAKGMIKLDGEYGRPTAALMERRAELEEKLAEALEFTRPKFNEDMRHGHTNM